MQLVKTLSYSINLFFNRSYISVLYVYSNRSRKLRPSQKEHLRCFGNYSGVQCYYVNIDIRNVPEFIFSISFDVIVFDWFFLDVRRKNSRDWERLLKKVEKISNLPGVRIALPQDECSFAKQLCEFINNFDVRYVFSLASESEWEKIYLEVDFSKTSFKRVLPAYVSDHSFKKIKKFQKRHFDRTIDIGYRAAFTPEWGRFGLLKEIIAKEFLNKVDDKISVDISTDIKDFLLGDKWYIFLLKCKYFLGVEGGGSLLDWDGSIAKKIREFLKKHPQAKFDEIESACFAGIDGKLALRSIGPRNLETCITKTCQVLLEGEYNGILVPWVHYIPVKNDFSNIKEVLAIIAKDEIRNEIVERAYRDIILSGKFSYKSYVNFILETVLEKPTSRKSNIIASKYYFIINQFLESFTFIYFLIVNFVKRKLGVLP